MSAPSHEYRIADHFFPDPTCITREEYRRNQSATEDTHDPDSVRSGAARPQVA